MFPTESDALTTNVLVVGKITGVTVPEIVPLLEKFNPVGTFPVIIL
jgi:hypothetical protein